MGSFKLGRGCAAATAPIWGFSPPQIATNISSPISLTPAAAYAIAAGINPTVMAGGSLSISPEAITAIAAGLDPDVVQTSMIITPAQISAIAAGADPDVVFQ